MTLKNMFSLSRVPFRAPQITLLTIAIGVFPIGIATAQSGTASIRGLVLDPQSRVVIGARITIVDDSNRLVEAKPPENSANFPLSACRPPLIGWMRRLLVLRN
jgi:hypothetical protein